MTMTEATALFTKMGYAEAKSLLAEECRRNGVEIDPDNASVFELCAGASRSNGVKADNGNKVEVILEKGNAPSDGEGKDKPVPTGDERSEAEGKSEEESKTSGEAESGEAEAKSNEDEAKAENESGKRKRNTPSWKSIAEQQKEEMEQLKEEMEKKLRDAEAKSSDPDNLSDIEAEMERLSKKAEAIREEERKRKEEEERKRKEAMKAHEHKQLHEVIRRLKCNGIVMLSGPAGTGKSTLALGACAKIFDIKGDFSDVVKSGKFAQISFSPDTMTADMLGFTDVNGVYHETDIVRVFREGGIMLFDEIDSADGTVLTKLNTMVANGTIPTPNGVVTRHPEAYFVWTGNTWGTGGDSMYMRNRLDAATLDRVVCSTIPVDYDVELERIICEGFGITSTQSAILNNVVKTIRKLINDNKWMRICSTRFIIHACKMMSLKDEPYTIKEIVESYLAPWDSHSRGVVMNSIGHMISL